MVLIRVTERGAVPGVAKRELNTMLKAAWEETGVHWHRSMRPKHFTHAGAREYGYTPRKGERGAAGTKGFRQSYTGRKLKRFGHTLPLVYTGESRELTRIRDVRATSKGVRIVMNAPKLNFRSRHSTINMRDEMTRISAGEARELVAVLDAAYQRRLDAVRDVRTREIA